MLPVCRVRRVSHLISPLFSVKLVRNQGRKHHREGFLFATDLTKHQSSFNTCGTSRTLRQHQIRKRCPEEPLVSRERISTQIEANLMYICPHEPRTLVSGGYNSQRSSTFYTLPASLLKRTQPPTPPHPPDECQLPAPQAHARTYIRTNTHSNQPAKLQCSANVPAETDATQTQDTSHTTQDTRPLPLSLTWLRTRPEGSW